MKRLTKRLEDGQAVMDCDTCTRTCTLLDCRNRLKDRVCDYEDVMQQNKLVEQKHGYWIDDCTNIVCSECKAEYSDEIVFMNRDFEYSDLNYCPNCGAKMDGGANNE